MTVRTRAPPFTSSQNKKRARMSLPFIGLASGPR